MLQLNALLARLRSGDETVEETRLDLKRKWPPFKGTNDKAEILQEFWKDICALANSSYPSPGYLVFGLTKDSPFLHDAPLPIDEASIQQIIASGVYPVPAVHFTAEKIEGLWVTVARVTSSARALPHVAKYKDVHVPWVRQGTTTRAASHLDLLGMFDTRSGSEAQAILRPRGAVFRWSNSWSSLGAWAWTPVEYSSAANSPIPGLQMELELLNAGRLETALVDLSLTLEWADSSAQETSVAYGTPRVPIDVRGRAGAKALAVFCFTAPFKHDPTLASRVVVNATDLDEHTHCFEFVPPKIVRT